MTLPKPTFPIITLTAANLVPLVGVLFFGWDVALIVLLYWSENVIVGFYNIFRMVLVKAASPVQHLSKLFAIPFFSLHFGGFCAVHGFFLLAFFDLGKDMSFMSSNHAWPGHLVFLQLLVSVAASLWRNHPPGMEWPFVLLFISHGISFVVNYVGKKEYAVMTIKQLMNRPYKRIVITHVAIIAGAVPIMMLGSPVPLLGILICLKTGMDVYLHTRTHRVDRQGKKTQSAVRFRRRVPQQEPGTPA